MIRRLVLVSASVSTLACSDAIFEPIASVTTPGAAVIDRDGVAVDAIATFSREHVEVTSRAGDLIVSLTLADLRAGRARVGRHRLRTADRDGADFAFLERYPTMGPLPIGPTASFTEGGFVWMNLGYQVRDGFIDITESNARSVSGKLYLRASTGYGPGSSTTIIRVSFHAVAPPDRTSRDEPITIDIPEPKP